MRNEDFVTWLFGKNNEKDDRNLYNTFWRRVTSSIEDRPNRAVRIYIRRKYQPDGSSGPWTAEEQARLEE
jgi:hypothetical protein